MAEKVSREASEAYFRSRPVSSQLGALASEQSAVIPSRAWLENRYRDLERQYAASDIPVPLHWGGFRVLPAEMEFWQGRENRLHDRFRYTRHGLGWKADRLSPESGVKIEVEFLLQQGQRRIFLTISSSFSPSV